MKTATENKSFITKLLVKEVPDEYRDICYELYQDYFYKYVVVTPKVKYVGTNAEGDLEFAVSFNKKFNIEYDDMVSLNIRHKDNIIESIKDFYPLHTEFDNLTLEDIENYESI